MSRAPVKGKSKKGQSKKVQAKKGQSKQTRSRIFTVGHSNHPISDFIELLQAHKVKLLIDVRKIPKSRHNPHFWGDKLAKSLQRQKIDYLYIAALGGRRPARKDSVNSAWRNPSFRGYADYTMTDEFKKAVKKVVTLSKRKKVALMCAEAVPWRCHRRLISDALVVHGHSVADIFSKTNAKPHLLTPFAKVNRRTKAITYPAT